MSLVNRDTPFRRFKTRTARWCAVCRKLIPGGDDAWKPSENKGGWKSTAVICEPCGETMRRAEEA